VHASCSRRSAAVRDDRLPSQDVPSVSLAALASHLPATSSRGGVSSKARTSHTELDRAENHASLDRATNHASLDRANGATPPLWSAATQGRCRAQRGGGDVRTRKANFARSNHASLDCANGATPPLWSAATQGRCRAQRGGGDVRTRKANVTSSEAEGTCELGRRASRDRTTPILLARLTHHRNAAPGTSPRRRSRGGVVGVVWSW
jgi:hypothetical protein